jgi:hypothetical protein
MLDRLSGSDVLIAIVTAFAGRAWMLLRAIPPLWLAIALCGAVAAFCWHGWHKEHVAHVANVKAMVEAGKRATDAQRALVEKIDAANLKAKDIADAKLPAQSLRADDAARAYIRLHPARSCGAGKADRAEAAPAAEVTDGSDHAAVVVSEADVMVCTANTTRLLNAQEWARGLIK